MREGEIAEASEKVFLPIIEQAEIEFTFVDPFITVFIKFFLSVDCKIHYILSEIKSDLSKSDLIKLNYSPIIPKITGVCEIPLPPATITVTGRFPKIEWLALPTWPLTF